MASATGLSRSGRVLAVVVETGAELGAESGGEGFGAPKAVGVCWDRDVREVLMHVGAVQRHFCAPDVVPRPGFEQLMLEANCHLILPKLGDSIVLLRTGVLMHIDR